MQLDGIGTWKCVRIGIDGAVVMIFVCFIRGFVFENIEGNFNIYFHLESLAYNTVASLLPITATPGITFGQFRKAKDLDYSESSVRFTTSLGKRDD